MSDAVPYGVFDVKHETDPVMDIKKAVGDISQVKVGPGLLLLGIYKRPEKSGLLIRSIREQTEDIYQGKTWLVLAKGPLCFADNDSGSFGGYSAEVGDWVLARNSDGYRCDIGGAEAEGGHQCLLVNHKYIKAVVPTPYMVW